MDLNYLCFITDCTNQLIIFACSFYIFDILLIIDYIKGQGLLLYYILFLILQCNFSFFILLDFNYLVGYYIFMILFQLLFLIICISFFIPQPPSSNFNFHYVEFDFILIVVIISILILLFNSQHFHLPYLNIDSFK